MNQKLAIALCVISGFCGSLFTLVSADRVHAQEKENVEQVIKAEKFVLVNPDGSTAGTLGLDSNGSPEITLMDSAGKVVWSTKPHLKTITR